MQYMYKIYTYVCTYIYVIWNICTNIYIYTTLMYSKLKMKSMRKIYNKTKRYIPITEAT